MWRYFIKVLVQKEVYPYYGGFVIIYDLLNYPEIIEWIETLNPWPNTERNYC